MELRVDGKKAFAYTAAHELDPKKSTVVFVHGAGLDHSWFGLQSRYFGYHGWNVLALDLPGHGRSEGPPLASIGEMAAWVLKVIENRKASVVGHSMGALVALECAARAPERVERIAFLGTAYPMKVSEAFLDAARRNDQAAYDMETIWGHAPQVPLGANPNPGMWMYGDTLARLARLAPGVLYNDLKACNDYAVGLESAAKVKCPALFVLGSRDVMTPPKSAAALAQAIRGSRTVILPPSGHSLMAEAPDATLDALIGFLSAD
ncbi:MAG TPA: alpha/beta hydrolase [Burkholderiales bacterium]|jgi:pimeloyl-ACP methyl ester carboxylesterase|nr:alpha/beta hydrolase [Burkholderiales bacterium]